MSVAFAPDRCSPAVVQPPVRCRLAMPADELALYQPYCERWFPWQGVGPLHGGDDAPWAGPV